MGIVAFLKRGYDYVRHGIPTNYTTVTVKEMSPSNVLEGKNIIITGGSRGLGYYIAKRCISEGAKVLITGRNEENLKRAAEEIGPNCVWVCFDVQDVKGIPQFLNKATEIFGGQKIHCLVSNAGISLHEGNFRNVTENGWNRQMDTNLKGNYFLVKEFIQYLETHEDKSGNIVVISSERSHRADDIPYGLTKVATNSFVQCFASKVIEHGIRINAVAPGVTASDMTGWDRNENMYAAWQPEKRIFIPEEVAEVVNFLLSDASRCISGEIITCNQGRHISHW